MSTLSIILQALLILYFVFSGCSKIARVKYWTDIFNRLKLPNWFLVVTGFVQLIGAAALITGFWYEGAVAWGGVWLGITMLLACIAHFRVKDSIGNTVPPFVFVGIILILVIIHTEDLLKSLS